MPDLSARNYNPTRNKSCFSLPFFFPPPCCPPTDPLLLGVDNDGVPAAHSGRAGAKSPDPGVDAVGRDRKSDLLVLSPVAMGLAANAGGGAPTCDANGGAEAARAAAAR